MKKTLFSLLVTFTLVAGSASAQTLLNEGKGAFLSTTPAVLMVPANTFGYNLSASYSHRLSRRFDVTGALGYSGSSVDVSAAAGYTNRFSEAGWGFRSGMAFSTFTSLEGEHHVSGVGGLSAMLFREVGLFSVLQVYPHVYLRSDVLLGQGNPDFEMSASLGVPVYFRVWREISLIVSPSYRLRLLPDPARGRYTLIGFGAQVGLPG